MGGKSLKDVHEAIAELEKTDDVNFEAANTAQGDDFSDAEDWISSFLEKNNTYVDEFSNLKITNNSDYVKTFENLSKYAVIDAENYRFCFQFDGVDQADPTKILAILPQWLLDMDIYYFDCDTRLKNFVSAQEISTVGCLQGFTLSDFLNAPKMGRGSVKKLCSALINTQKKGPPPTADDPEASSKSLHEGFFKSLNKIEDETHLKIIKERLGVDTAPRTLEEIGQDIGITRERVRQIQKKVTARIIDGEFWDDTLKYKVQSLLNNPSEPVYLDEMGKFDPWLDGFVNNQTLLQNLIIHFSHMSPKFLKINDRAILAQIDNELWRETRSSLLDGFEYDLSFNYSLEDIELLVENALRTKNASELNGLMFSDLYQDLNFSMVDGEMILVSIGNSTGSKIKIILEESDTPLHYKEIKKRYENKFGVEISDRNIHARLNYNGFNLFDRGTYGNDKHIGLSDTGRTEIIHQTEKVISSDVSRQWHSSEILKKIIPKLDSLLCKRIDQYILNICLHKSNNISYLGKMIWVLKGEETEYERLQIKNLVVTVLKQSGRPMKGDEIEIEIKRLRSVGSFFIASLQPNELYSRVDPATWGLIDRDFILNLSEWGKVKTFLFDRLNHINSALHSSEIMQALQELDLPENINIGHVLGIVNVDDRFRKWRGNLVGLSNWSTPNRLTISEALEMFVPQSSNNVISSDIETKMKTALGYDFNKSRIHAHLYKEGFAYDNEQQCWKKVT